VQVPSKGRRCLIWNLKQGWSGTSRPAAKDTQTTYAQQPAGLELITMTDAKDSKSDLGIKDIYNDISLRFDATQRSQMLIHETLSHIVQEIQDLKRRQREMGI
jgi:hypothetical protein